MPLFSHFIRGSGGKAWVADQPLGGPNARRLAGGVEMRPQCESFRRIGGWRGTLMRLGTFWGARREWERRAVFEDWVLNCEEML